MTASERARLQNLIDDMNAASLLLWKTGHFERAAAVQTEAKALERETLRACRRVALL